LLGTLYLYLGLRLEKRAPAFDAEGTLSRDGLVTLTGGAVIQLPGATPVDRGPVVVRIREPSARSYRDAASPTVAAWRSGTLLAMHDEHHSRVTLLLTSAICTPLLCGAPLLFGVLAGWR
jgi:hypothetical protein